MREKRKEVEKLPHQTGCYFLRDPASRSTTWDDSRQATQSYGLQASPLEEKWRTGYWLAPFYLLPLGDRVLSRGKLSLALTGCIAQLPGKPKCLSCGLGFRQMQARWEQPENSRASLRCSRQWRGPREASPLNVVS